MRGLFPAIFVSGEGAGEGGYDLHREKLVHPLDEWDEGVGVFKHCQRSQALQELGVDDGGGGGRRGRGRGGRRTGSTGATRAAAAALGGGGWYSAGVLFFESLVRVLDVDEHDFDVLVRHVLVGSAPVQPQHDHHAVKLRVVHGVVFRDTVDPCTALSRRHRRR